MTADPSSASSPSRAHIDIVGLGPAGAEYVTEHTMNVIAANEVRFVRTSRHPSAPIVVGARSLDHHYETAADFEGVYRGIVDELAEQAIRSERIVYAVPGSPLVLERTVRLLLDDDRVTCTIHPAMSFLDLVWPKLGIDPIDSAVRLVDGHRFATAAAGDEGALLVAHCHANWVLSDIKLAAEDCGRITNDDVEAVVLHHLGLEDEVVLTVPWSDIDRAVDADHLTSLYVPGLAVPVGRSLVAFHELARRLRRECPWDKEQTHRSLTTYLLEETYEVVDALLALDENDPSTDDDLMEELGDLLYQIEFHAAIAEQEGRFTMGDVAQAIHDKMVRRHPHVFGAASGDVFGAASGDDESPDALAASWDAIKKAERAAKAEAGRVVDDSPFAGIVEAAGSLAYASSVLSRSARAGHPYDAALEAGNRLAAIEDLGMHLLQVVAECRRRKVDPEVLLREAARAHRSVVEEAVRSEGQQRGDASGK